MENTIEKSNLKILGKTTPEFDRILTNEALLFIEAIENQFGERRRNILKTRGERQSEIDRGIFPNFLSSTQDISCQD